MNLRYFRERHPRRCRYRGFGNYRRDDPAGSAGHGLPDSKFCSGTSAGENSTASTDRGRTADLLIASFPLPGVTRRAGPLFPAGRIHRRGALTMRPKGA